jgi:hypothetical protein
MQRSSKEKLKGRKKRKRKSRVRKGESWKIEKEQRGRKAEANIV